MKKQGNNIDFKRVPVAFRDDFVPHSKLFYAVSALGISEKVTPAIFNAIHKQKNYLLTPQAQADSHAGRRQEAVHGRVQLVQRAGRSEPVGRC